MTNQEEDYPISKSKIGSGDMNCNNGCLFEIFSDPAETTDLVLTLPDVHTEMKEMLSTLNKQRLVRTRGGM